LRDLNRLIGTQKDSNEHRKEIQGVMSNIMNKIQQLQKVNLALKQNAKRVDQKAVYSRFQTEADDLTREFQRTCKQIDTNQKRNPLLSENPFGEDSEEESLLPQNHTTSDQLQLEAERREIRERNEAFQDLLQDINGLNDLMKQIAVEVVEQQDTIDLIEDDVDGAAENVTKGTKNLQKASWLKKSSRKLIIIIVLILVGVVVAIIVAIILAICLTGHCSSKSNS
jgi:t-SNARE complex subunit (syntaxin)